MIDSEWAERVAALSIHPDAATSVDVARMAAELCQKSQFLFALSRHLDKMLDGDNLPEVDNG